MARTSDRQALYPNLKKGGTRKIIAKKTRGRPFAKGNGGGGRPKGVPNKVTRDVRRLAQGILEDPIVQARLKLQAQRGSLPPPIMSLLFSYAYGPPKQQLEITSPRPILVHIVDEFADEAPTPRPLSMASDSLLQDSEIAGRKGGLPAVDSEP